MPGAGGSMLNFAWSSSQLSAVFIRDFPGNYFAAHVEIVQSGRGMLCSQRLEEIAKGRAEGRPTPMALSGISARNRAQSIQGNLQSYLGL